MYNFRENWFPTQAGSAAATTARRRAICHPAVGVGVCLFQ